MGSYTKVGTTSEFKDGSKKKVTVGGQEILIARVSNKYYAIDNRCPHLGGDLSAGVLVGHIITCPRHGSKFDVRDGKNLRWMKGSGLIYTLGSALKSPQSAKSYKVKIEGTDILVEV
jgi:3-phenylpropionate/trans-cinnamate dioxygenase ferredoxin subunit